MESPFSSSSQLPNFAAPPVPSKVKSGALAPLLSALALAIGVGIIYHFVARYYDLIIAFPAIAGGLIGSYIAFVARKNKVRSKAVLWSLGLACGLLCFGTRQFSDSLYNREQMLPLIAQRVAKKYSQPEPVVEARLRSFYHPLRYFPLYLKGAAKQGIALSSAHSFSSSSTMPMRGEGYWLLFSLEVLVICGAATGRAWAQATKPFCEPCDDWYGPDLTVIRLHYNQFKEALRLVKSGDYGALAYLRNKGARDNNHCDLLLSKCAGCGVARVKLRTQRGQIVKWPWQSDPSSEEVGRLEELRAQWLQ